MEVVNNYQHLAAVDFLFVEVGDMEYLAFMLLKIIVDVATEVLFNLPTIHQVDAAAIVTTFEKHATQLLNECTLAAAFSPTEINIAGLVLLSTSYELFDDAIEEFLPSHIAIAIGEI